MPEFRFSIPPLPKEWYDWLKKFRETYHVTYWQGIVCALWALALMLKEPTAGEVASIVAEVKKRYPHETVKKGPTSAPAKPSLPV